MKELWISGLIIIDKMLLETTGSAWLQCSSHNYAREGRILIMWKGNGKNCRQILIMWKGSAKNGQNWHWSADYNCHPADTSKGARWLSCCWIKLFNAFALKPTKRWQGRPNLITSSTSLKVSRFRFGQSFKLRLWNQLSEGYTRNYFRVCPLPRYPCPH